MLVYRQKVLLALLEAFGGNLQATDFQKYLFLYTQKCEREKSYDFVPFKFGCYSFQAAVDKKKLEEKGYLKPEKGWELQKPDISYSHVLKKGEALKISRFFETFKNMKGKALIHYVYTNYPYYAINSEIAESNLNAQELSVVQDAKPIRKRKHLLATIGYEGGSVENYLNRLIESDIRLLVDVRKNPISRKYGFSKNTLSKLLGNLGIEYVHIPELGIESSERQSLNTQNDYDRLFSKYEKTVLLEQEDALDSVLGLYEDKKRIALTCFEKEHFQCHRGRVVNKLLEMDDSIATAHL